MKKERGKTEEKQDILTHASNAHSSCRFITLNNRLYIGRDKKKAYLYIYADNNDFTTYLPPKVKRKRQKP